MTDRQPPFSRHCSQAPGLPLPPLPFHGTSLDDAQMRRVFEVLSRWAAGTGLARKGHVQVAAEYARHCSAPSPTPAGIELGAEYLAWFLCINDLPPDEYKRSMLREVKSLLQGKVYASYPEAEATRGFLDRVECRVGDRNISRFRRRVLEMIDAFEWEVDWLQTSPRRIPTTDAYLRWRQHLIAHYPYVELWRLTENVEVNRPRVWAALERVETANTQVILWVNDVLSIARDERKGKINLVACIASGQGCSPEAALCQAQSRLDQCVVDYRNARDALRSIASESAGIARHIRFLDSVLEGNRAATVELHDRFWGDG